MINQYLLDGSISELAFGRICAECAKQNQLSRFSYLQQEKANFYEVEKFCSSMAGRHEFSLTPTVKKSSPSRLEVSHNNVKSELTGKHYSRQDYKIMLNVFLQGLLSQTSKAPLTITVSWMLQLTQQEVTLVGSPMSSQNKTDSGESIHTWYSRVKQICRTRMAYNVPCIS